MINASRTVIGSRQNKPSSTFTGSETAANLNSANAKTVTVKAKWKSNEPTIPTGACTGTYGSRQNVNLAVNGTTDFSYTGSVTCAYLQKAGYYKLEVWGAQGGSTTHGSIGGYGGYSYGKINSESGSSLYVVIGGTGTKNNSSNSIISGGYNGGGNAYGSSHGTAKAASGGGLSHISTYNCGELRNCSAYKTNILIVAGGGGGAGDHSTIQPGGSGGGYEAGRGDVYGSYCYGTGGTQTTAGICTGGNESEQTPTAGGFGYGQTYTSSNISGGWVGGGSGGGWYGGGHGGPISSAGGGSGYIGNSLLLSDKKMYCYNSGIGACVTSTATATYTVGTSSTGAHVANAANTGNGYARITYLGT